MARLGIVLYWVATAIAIAVVVLAILAYFTAKGSGALEGALFIVAYAILVWLILIFARSALTPRYRFRTNSGSSAISAQSATPRRAWGTRQSATFQFTVL